MSALPSFGAALLNPQLPVPAVVGRRGVVDQRRFAVYRNNVFVSLVGALAARFPVTARLVGEDFFNGMARAYAGAHQPKTPVLMTYGDDFAAFIRAFPPAASLNYLADIAAIEAKWGDAYNAADHPPLALVHLAALAGDQLASARFVIHPAAALIHSATPAGSIWAAHQSEPFTPVTTKGGEVVAISRPGLEVQVTVLPPVDAAFAMALFAGETIDNASESAPSENFDAGAALVGLISLGCFSGLK